MGHLTVRNLDRRHPQNPAATIFFLTSACLGRPELSSPRPVRHQLIGLYTPGYYCRRSLLQDTTLGSDQTHHRYACRHCITSRRLLLVRTLVRTPLRRSVSRAFDIPCNCCALWCLRCSLCEAQGYTSLQWHWQQWLLKRVLSSARSRHQAVGQK
jgi:hypothetical protein